MIDKKKIVAIIVFVFFGLFMFAFANPSEKNLVPIDDNGNTIVPDKKDDDKPVGKAPVIKLGKNVTSIEVFDNIPKFNATADSGKVVITHKINNGKVGTYVVTVTATNEFGKSTKTFNFNVVDTTAPVITLIGENEIIRKGDNYQDKGATAQDNYDGNITDEIVVTNDLNNDKKGTYEYKYNVIDANNNEALEVIRQVIVTDADDLQESIDEGNKIIKEIGDREVSKELEELLDELEKENEKGNDLIDDHKTNQEDLDEEDEIIEEIIEKIKNLKFNVTYVDFDDSVIKSYVVKFMEDALVPENPTRKGYEFTGWNNKAVKVVNDLTIKALYKVVTYDITYDLDGGKVNGENPTTYTIETETFKLVNPTRAGYTFLGWNKAGNVKVTIKKGTTGDKSYKAIWIANKFTPYTVNHYVEKLEGGYKLADTDKFVGTTDTLTKAFAKLYIGFTAQKFDQVNINGDGSAVVNIYYNRNSYKLIIKGANGISDIKVNGEENAGSYKYGESIKVTYKVANGYTDLTLDRLKFTMGAHDEYVTLCTLLNKYAIIYDLNGGSLSKLNPVIYTVETDTFKLNNPTKAGYTFLGWNKDGNVDVTIEKGTTGIKTFVALWKANTDTKYTVKHYQEGLNGKYELVDTDNLTGITDTFTNAQAKEYSGFTAQKIKQERINGNGTTVIEVKYTRNSYKLTINTTNGITDVKVNNSKLAKSYKYGQAIKITYKVADGYTDATTDDTNFTIDLSNKVVNLKANVETYTITYDLDGGSLSKLNPSTYTVETETFKLNNPTKAGYTFDGWNKDGNVKVTIKKGSTGDKSFKALWTANKNTKYTVKHYQEGLDGEYKLVDTDNLTGTTDLYTKAKAKTYAGFTAEDIIQEKINGNGTTVIEVKYTRNNYEFRVNTTKGIIDVLVNGKENAGSYKYGELVNVTYKVAAGYEDATTDATSLTIALTNNVVNLKASINDYKITYDLDGGNATNRKSYTVETDTFTLNNPTKDGYTFDGWNDKGNVEVTIEKGTIGDKAFKALWTANNNTKYTVKHYQEGLDGEYELVDTDNLTGTTDELTNAQAKEYVGFTAQDITQEKINGNGTTVIEVKYTRNNYELVINADEGVETVLVNDKENAGSYKYGESIKVTYTFKDGYTLKNASNTNFEMPANKVVVDIESKKTQHSITYDLNGGTCADASCGNATTFITGSDVNINSDNMPVKEHYDFIGWTGYNLNEAKKEFTITNAPDNDIVLVANWVEHKYSISYELDNGVVENENPTWYTISSAAFTLNNPTKDGYTFTGWTGTSLVRPESRVTIATGSFGNRSYVANYKANEYTVKFDAKGGKAVSDKRVTYNKAYGTLPVTTKTGYTFLGWYTNNDIKVNETDIYTLTSNQTLYAHWALNTYTVTYKADGNKDIVVENVNYGDKLLNTYSMTKAQTAEFTYTHDGWALTKDGAKLDKNYVIDGSNLVFYAHFAQTRRSYDVTFDAGNGEFKNGKSTKVVSVEYGKAATLPEDPTLENYTFAGWTGNYNKITGPTTITAKYDANQIALDVELVTGGQLAFTLNDQVEVKPATVKREDTTYLVDLMNVYKVYADGKKVLTTEYKTNIDTKVLATAGKTLVVTQNDGKFSNTTKKYFVNDYPTVASKFEVIYGTNSYNATKDGCKGSEKSGWCNVGNNVKPVKVSKPFLEVIEHYQENVISVTGVTIEYNNGSIITSDDYHKVSGKNYERVDVSNKVRYTKADSKAYYDPVRIIELNEYTYKSGLFGGYNLTQQKDIDVNNIKYVTVKFDKYDDNGNRKIGSSYVKFEYRFRDGQHTFVPIEDPDNN